MPWSGHSELFGRRELVCAALHSHHETQARQREALPRRTAAIGDLQRHRLALPEQIQPVLILRLTRVRAAEGRITPERRSAPERGEPERGGREARGRTRTGW